MVLTKIYICASVYLSKTSTHQSSRNSLWNLLEEEIANFSTTGHILLTGNFNAHTGSLPDYASHDSDLHILLPQTTVNTPTKENRRIVWSIITVESYWIYALLYSRLRIINGLIGPDDNKGALTCFTPRGVSVVDYTIASDDFLHYVSHFLAPFTGTRLVTTLAG